MYSTVYISIHSKMYGKVYSAVYSIVWFRVMCRVQFIGEREGGWFIENKSTQKAELKSLHTSIYRPPLLKLRVSYEVKVLITPWVINHAGHRIQDPAVSGLMPWQKEDNHKRMTRTERWWPDRKQDDHKRMTTTWQKMTEDKWRQSIIILITNKLMIKALNLYGNRDKWKTHGNWPGPKETAISRWLKSDVLFPMYYGMLMSNKKNALSWKAKSDFNS